MPYHPASTSGYIAGNSGKYMSPFTHDGVIADWVDAGARVMAGKQIGKSTAGIGGAVLGQRYGGTLGAVLGRTVGQLVGIATAKAASIRAIGGWEYIQANSDISFDSYGQMAHYLRQNFSNHPHYERAIDMTIEIYPKLGPYIR